MSKVSKSSKKIVNQVPKEEEIEAVNNIVDNLKMPELSDNGSEAASDKSLSNDLGFQYTAETAKATKAVKKVEVPISLSDGDAEFMRSILKNLVSEIAPYLQQDERLQFLNTQIETLIKQINIEKHASFKKALSVVFKMLKTILEVYVKIETCHNVITNIIRHNFNPDLVKCEKKTTKSKRSVPTMSLELSPSTLSWISFNMLTSVPAKSFFAIHCREIQILNLFIHAMLVMAKKISEEAHSTISKSYINIIKSYIEYAYSDTGKIAAIKKISSLASSSNFSKIKTNDKFIRPQIFDAMSSTSTPSPPSSPSSPEKIEKIKKTKEIKAPNFKKKDIEALIPADIQKKLKSSNNLPKNMIEKIENKIVPSDSEDEESDNMEEDTEQLANCISPSKATTSGIAEEEDSSSEDSE